MKSTSIISCDWLIAMLSLKNLSTNMATALSRGAYFRWLSKGLTDFHVCQLISKISSTGHTWNLKYLTCRGIIFLLRLICQHGTTSFQIIVRVTVDKSSYPYNEKSYRSKTGSLYCKGPRLSDDHPICSVFTWHSVSPSRELYRCTYIVCSTWIHPLPIALHPLSYRRWHITISLKNESSRNAIIVVIEINICAHIFVPFGQWCLFPLK